MFCNWKKTKKTQWICYLANITHEKDLMLDSN